MHSWFAWIAAGGCAWNPNDPEEDCTESCNGRCIPDWYDYDIAKLKDLSGAQEAISVCLSGTEGNGDFTCQETQLECTSLMRTCDDLMASYLVWITQNCTTTIHKCNATHTRGVSSDTEISLLRKSTMCSRFGDTTQPQCITVDRFNTHRTGAEHCRTALKVSYPTFFAMQCETVNVYRNSELNGKKIMLRAELNVNWYLPYLYGDHDSV